MIQEFYPIAPGDMGNPWASLQRPPAGGWSAVAPRVAVVCQADLRGRPRCAPRHPPRPRPLSHTHAGSRVGRGWPGAASRL